LAFVSAFGLRASLISSNLGEKENTSVKGIEAAEKKERQCQTWKKRRHSSPAASLFLVIKMAPQWHAVHQRCRVAEKHPFNFVDKSISRIKTFHDLQCTRDGQQSTLVAEQWLSATAKTKCPPGAPLATSCSTLKAKANEAGRVLRNRPNPLANVNLRSGKMRHRKELRCFGWGCMRMMVMPEHPRTQKLVNRPHNNWVGPIKLVDYADTRTAKQKSPPLFHEREREHKKSFGCPDGLFRPVSSTCALSYAIKIMRRPK
jgi:hypothetical protein